LLNRKYPAVQKVTLSAYADDASRAACLSHGAELFLEKTARPADLEIIFATLLELARHKPTINGFRGVLRQVSLQDVIQMECLNRNSSILEVNAGQWQGEIFIKRAPSFMRIAADRNGEAGLNKILALKGGEFNLRPYVEPPQQTIDGSWEFLLMEAAQARDEAGEIEEAPPSEADLPLMPRPAPPVRPPASAYVPPASTPVSPPARSVQPASSVTSVPAVPERIAAPLGNNPARIDELIVCSAKGEVLYEWQCPTPATASAFSNSCRAINPARRGPQPRRVRPFGS